MKMDSRQPKPVGSSPLEEGFNLDEDPTGFVSDERVSYQQNRAEVGAKHAPSKFWEFQSSNGACFAPTPDL
jgi:hypothetical protein